MSSKHFINDPIHLILAALTSLSLTNPAVAVDLTHKIVYLRPSDHNASPSAFPQPHVSIISGGGSGHEPSFGALVGRGLLTAAVAGTIFASPSAEQVRTAILGRVENFAALSSSAVPAPAGRGRKKDDSGVLVTIMNYTGDVLNFGLAVEQARAAVAGLRIEMVVVGDDVGVGRQRGGKVGRRGIAGTVLVHKIAGALAARGAGLTDVAAGARRAAENVASVGASLARVHVPGRTGEEKDEEGGLEEGEVELGMGIHNERGSSRQRLELPALVGEILRQLLDREDKDRAFFEATSGDVVLLVNNLGGVSVLEMGAITTEVAVQLDKDYGIRPVRILTGPYMTSLNGLGFSITLLNAGYVEIGGRPCSMVDLLDDPCEATGWAAPVSRETWEARNVRTRDDEAKAAQGPQETGAYESGLKTNGPVMQAALETGLARLVSVEPEVTKYDSVVGDGDCGTGLKRGAIAILGQIATRPFTGDPIVDMAPILTTVETTMDGTSGALYAIFLNSLLHSLKQLPPGDLTPHRWAQALRSSCDALSKYTPARPGDRTLIDALHPFVDVLEKTGDVLEAARASKRGAEMTKGMRASLGRAVYVGGSGFEQVPDPGAWGLACFFEGLAEALGSG